MWPHALQPKKSNSRSLSMRTFNNVVFGPEHFGHGGGRSKSAMTLLVANGLPDSATRSQGDG
jgi:hypothetical protein